MFCILWGEDAMLYGSIEQSKMKEWMNKEAPLRPPTVRSIPQHNSSHPFQQLSNP